MADVCLNMTSVQFQNPFCQPEACLKTSRIRMLCLTLRPSRASLRTHSGSLNAISCTCAESDMFFIYDYTRMLSRTLSTGGEIGTYAECTMSGLTS